MIGTGVRQVRETPNRAHEWVFRGKGMPPDPAPKHLAPIAHHDTLVPIAIAFAQGLDAPVADRREFVEGWVEDGESLILQFLASISEHLCEGLVTVADHPVLGHDDSDRGEMERELREIPVVIGIVYGQGARNSLGPFVRFAAAEGNPRRGGWQMLCRGIIFQLR